MIGLVQLLAFRGNQTTTSFYDLRVILEEMRECSEFTVHEEEEEPPRVVTQKWFHKLVLDLEDSYGRVKLRLECMSVGFL